MAKKPTPRYVNEIRTMLGRKQSLAQEDIDAAVEKVLKANRIDAPPVDVQKLAKSLSFDLLTTKFKPGNGIIGLMGDGPTDYRPLGSKRFIVMEENSDRYRKIGTIAHELGHFFIDCDDTETPYLHPRTIGEDCSDRENYANWFKDTLLMPKPFVYDFLKQRRGDVWTDILSDMKAEFFVPKHTAKARVECILNRLINETDVFTGAVI